MADIVSAEKRSRMMAGIRGKNTKPEMIIRTALHRLGFRYRIHDTKLPGKPDMVFPQYRAVIFIHGCFWHGHDCHLFKWPSSREDFWKTKILGNRKNDALHIQKLVELGWRTGFVWECALKGKKKQPLEQTVESCATWLKSTDELLIIKGTI